MKRFGVYPSHLAYTTPCISADNITSAKKLQLAKILHRYKCVDIVYFNEDFKGMNGKLNKLKIITKKLTSYFLSSNLFPQF